MPATNLGRTQFKSINLPKVHYQGTRVALGIFQRLAFGLVLWPPRHLLLFLEYLKMMRSLLAIGGVVVHPLCRRLRTCLGTSLRRSLQFCYLLSLAWWTRPYLRTRLRRWLQWWTKLAGVAPRKLRPSLLLCWRRGHISPPKVLPPPHPEGCRSWRLGGFFGEASCGYQRAQ